MDQLLYKDKLIEIFDNSIIFHDYYFPFRDKRVEFENVDSVVVLKPTILSGKYRYYGTGDFRTWFPPDHRSSRDKIFVMKMRKKWWRVGFTVESSQTVLNILKNKCSVIDKSIED